MNEPLTASLSSMFLESVSRVLPSRRCNPRADAKKSGLGLQRFYPAVGYGHNTYWEQDPRLAGLKLVLKFW